MCRLTVFAPRTARRPAWVRFGRVATSVVAIAALAGCSVGPDYVRPAVRTPPNYKEAKGWRHATPRDMLDRGAWWEVYHDPTLSALERQVEISNQTIAAAVANYRLAVAIIKEAQSGLFPTVSADYTGTRSHEGLSASSSRGTTLTTAPSTSTTTTTGTGTTATGTTGSTIGTGTTGTGATTTTGTSTSGISTTTAGASGVTINTFSLEASATWELDVWGRVRRQIESDVASAQVSAADVASARLLAQAQLATAYFNLRAEDSLHRLLADTVAAYQRTLQITQNQYAAGTAARSDVDNALAQLKTAQAQEIATGVLRTQYEHAIAVLTGKAPAEVSIRLGLLGDHPLVVPASVPSDLLERRPDIAAAERTMQAYNEQIGVAAAAFYPDISLSGAVGAIGRSALPLTAANEIWSFGGNVAETLLDGGQRLAAVAASTASYDASVATYRETVLTAFQQVEDELSASRVLAQQAAVQNEAVQAAQSAVDITLNEYRAGTVAFTSVVTAQATLLGDQVTALSVRQNRYLASVALIQALGGGWSTAGLPSGEALRAAPTPRTSSPNLSSDVFTPKLNLWQLRSTQ